MKVKDKGLYIRHSGIQGICVMINAVTNKDQAGHVACTYERTPKNTYRGQRPSLLSDHNKIFKKWLISGVF